MVTYTAVRKRSVRLPVDDQARNELARRRVRLSSRAPRHTPQPDGTRHRAARPPPACCRGVEEPGGPGMEHAWKVAGVAKDHFFFA